MFVRVLYFSFFPLRHLVKTTVLLADINDFSAMNEVYQEFLREDDGGEALPARIVYQAAALPLNARFEMMRFAKSNLSLNNEIIVI